MRIAIILGTRPEIIKLSPVIKVCQQQGRDFFIIHTNQHYDANLDQVFFEELALPTPKYNLRIGSGSHGLQTGNMMKEIESILQKERPQITLVQGDTNTALAGALVACKLHIMVGHIEAGLRSNDRKMPEEINRILVDHCADLLFAPTQESALLLLGEGIPKERIFVTGNTIVDVIYCNKILPPEKTGILERLSLTKRNYILLTLHRPENVDSEEVLKNIFKGLVLMHDRLQLPIILPIHPRTVKMLQRFQMAVPSCIAPIDPVGYFDFLMLQKNAKLIMTDSGGIQEEACIMGIPCVTLRENTERPETVEVGANMLSGTDPDKILFSAEIMLAKKKKWKNPFGAGNAAKLIMDVVGNREKKSDRKFF